MLSRLLTTSALAAGLALAGCDSDSTFDTPDPAPQALQRFQVEITNTATGFGILKSGAFDTPVGASAPGPIGPGGAYAFSFTAGPNVTPGSGMRLSLATMFIQSNDLFYAFPPDGLALYDDDGNARVGDVTGELFLYDAGTEVNEEPGVGPNQAPRQSGPDTGAAENGNVVLVDGTDSIGFSYPDAEDVIRVTLAHDGDTEFTVRIENVSDASTLPIPGGAVPVPLSPGGWAVHVDAVDFYTLGSAAPAGIEEIAEDGDASVLAAAVTPMTGVTVPLSPGAAAVHSSAVDFFEVGAAASDGIEGIAEDGDPSAAVAGLAGVSGIRSVEAFNTPVGASAPAPIGPGGRYRFEVEAAPGERLSLATMYVQSNDWLLAPNPDGIALFDASGRPISGDVSDQILLWDAGTEADEEPGVGLNQAPRQSGPDTGEAEGGVIREISSGAFPPASEVIRVTVTPVDG
jgi:hypothetical protein